MRQYELLIVCKSFDLCASSTRKYKTNCRHRCYILVDTYRWAKSSHAAKRPA